MIGVTRRVLLTDNFDLVKAYDPVYSRVVGFCDGQTERGGKMSQDEILLENESDKEEQLDRICRCGVAVRDHYDRFSRDIRGRETWKPCFAVSLATETF